MSSWTKWLTDRLQKTGAKTKPSLQEERILRIAEMIRRETEEAPAAKEKADEAPPPRR